MSDRLDRRTFECPLVSVSDIIRDHGLRRVNLLKVDAEKCELEILRGIENDVWPLIDQVVVEVHDRSRRAVEVVQINAVRTLGAGEIAIYREVVIPGSMPGILLGLRIALGNAWAAVVAAEMFGAQGGLGYLITQSVVFFELSDVMVGMVLIGFTGFVLDWLFLRFMDRCLRWMPPQEAA